MVLTETQNGDNTHYHYGPGNLPYAQIGPTGTITYLHHDQLGSTRLLTSTTGTVTGTATYTPYGTPEATTGTLTSFGYTGQYTDPETGYQYLRARYYNPTTAQFITKDPAAARTREAHGYASNNPTNLTDPSGLWPWDGMCVSGINCPDRGERPIGEIWASKHPEAAQQALDFLSGVSSVNPVTVATDALGLTDTSEGACTTSGWYRTGQISMLAADLTIGGSAAWSRVNSGRGLGFGNTARVARHQAHKPFPTTFKGTPERTAHWLKAHPDFRTHWHFTWRGTRSGGI
jgi:RHS repeat-associated protein